MRALWGTLFAVALIFVAAGIVYLLTAA